MYEGCICREESCTNIECSCMCLCAYDPTGRLKVEYFAAVSKPVFECNSNCGCSSTCQNRVTQHHPLPTDLLQRFQATPNGKGYGARALHDAPQGTFIGEYVGEIISKAEAKRRLDKLSPDDSCYVLTYREHLSSGTILTTSIDATHAGNITRFMNHSCSPNVTIVPVRDDSIVPRLCLFTCKDVASGEELCFSYFGCSSVDLVDRRALALGEKKCLCGSNSCLQYLPLQN